MQMNCEDATSVIAAIQHGWKNHAPPQEDPFHRWAVTLNTWGYITDADDDLQILEHCRRHKLQVTDVLEELDLKIRESGYHGGTLSVADCTVANRPCFVFFDSLRFRGTKEISTLLASLQPDTSAQ